jgi:hypothetical protein
MMLFTRQTADSSRTLHRPVFRSLAEEPNPEPERRKPARDHKEHEPASRTEPTLDDFGGRSDALGG